MARKQKPRMSRRRFLEGTGVAIAAATARPALAAPFDSAQGRPSSAPQARTRIRLTINGVAQVPTPLENLRSVHVIAGSGDDTITVLEDSSTGGKFNVLTLLEGGDGDDTITGGSGYDVIRGGAGDDVISTGDGFNIVAAGDGDDRVTGGAGHDLILAGAGNDVVDTGGGDNAVYDEVGAAMADQPEWLRLRRLAFGLEDAASIAPTIAEQVRAGLRLYVLTSELLDAALQPEDRPIIELTVTRIREALPPAE